MTKNDEAMTTTDKGSSPPAPNTPIAFFDLDHTLLPFDCHLLFVNFLLQECRTSGKFWIQIPFYFFFTLGLLGYSCHLIAAKPLKRTLLVLLQGYSVQKVKNLCQKFVDQTLRPLLFPELVSRIHWHQKKKHIVILNSGSLNLYVEPLGRSLGVHAVVATEVAMKTPFPFFPKISGKNNIGQTKIHKMQSDPKISPWLRASSAPSASSAPDHHKKNYTYTDHPNDLPLIGLAQEITIIAKNKKHPDLQKEGEKKGWKFLRPSDKFLLLDNPYAIFKQFLGIYNLPSFLQRSPTTKSKR